MALKIALDTNRYVDFCKGEASIVPQVRTAGKIYLPFIVLGELRAGFASGAHQEQNAKLLSRFLNSSRVSVLLADEQTTHHYARVFAQLRKAGTPVPTNDLWIAALILQHDLVLCTRDKHFRNIPQLPVL